jgi:hypothetical protein
MADESDKRGAPRLKLAEQGKILLPAEQVWVAIHDLSETGAKLEVWSGTTLPDAFDLMLVKHKLTVHASLEWREGEFAGVSFARIGLAR